VGKLESAEVLVPSFEIVLNVLPQHHLKNLFQAFCFSIRLCGESQLCFQSLEHRLSELRREFWIMIWDDDFGKSRPLKDVFNEQLRNCFRWDAIRHLGQVPDDYENWVVPLLLGTFVIKSREIDPHGYSEMVMSRSWAQVTFQMSWCTFRCLFYLCQYRSFQMSSYTFMNLEWAPSGTTCSSCMINWISQDSLIYRVLGSSRMKQTSLGRGSTLKQFIDDSNSSLS
jgi:hypothetical protein